MWKAKRRMFFSGCGLLNWNHAHRFCSLQIWCKCARAWLGLHANDQHTPCFVHLAPAVNSSSLSWQLSAGYAIAVMYDWLLEWETLHWTRLSSLPTCLMVQPKAGGSLFLHKQVHAFVCHISAVISFVSLTGYRLISLPLATTCMFMWTQISGCISVSQCWLRNTKHVQYDTSIQISLKHT